MTTPTTKQFHIGDIISITDGSLVSPRHVGGVYDILNWTIKTPDWSGVAKDKVEAAVMSWLAEPVDIHGSTRDVAPLPTEDHASIDPIAELKMMRPDMPIIVVNTATEES